MAWFDPLNNSGGWHLIFLLHLFINTPYCYDNLCNLERLKMLQKPLPLDHPKNNIWKKTSHIVDELHIQNHKRAECKTL